MNKRFAGQLIIAGYLIILDAANFLVLPGFCKIIDLQLVAVLVHKIFKRCRVVRSGVTNKIY